jgi:branched-chain amino acid transport system ATP-binding protein
LAAASILEVSGVAKRFGGLQALADVTFSVPRGGIYGVMGANGAGKTTLFAVIAGFLQPDAGSVRLEGRAVTGLAPSRLCEAGIARTFQITRPFPELSVLDTVRVGALVREHRMPAATARAGGILERFKLAGRRNALGRELTVLERKRLEIARAYATGPKLLLLDEVAAGLRPAEVEELIALVREIAAEGVTVLMIEHVLAAIFALAQRVLVLDHGRRIAEGTPEEISHDRAVVEAYLGAEFGLA